MPETADAAQDKALEAANQIAEQVATLWKSAHTAGVRDGLEVAAQITDAIAKAIADDYSIPAEVRSLATTLFASNRDQMRLAAHQVPDPEPGS